MSISCCISHYVMISGLDYSVKTLLFLLGYSQWILKENFGNFDSGGAFYLCPSQGTKFFEM